MIYGSTRKTSEIIRIYHTGIGIALGTFSISQIESLYVESNELSLKLRRGILGLRYYLKLKSCLLTQHMTALLTQDVNIFSTKKESNKDLRNPNRGSYKKKSIPVERINRMELLDISTLDHQTIQCHNENERATKSHNSPPSYTLNNFRKSVKNTQII